MARLGIFRLVNLMTGLIARSGVSCGSCLFSFLLLIVVNFLHAGPPWEEPLLPGPVYSSRELTWRSALIVSLKVDKTGELQVDQILYGNWDGTTPPPIPQTIPWPPNALRGIGFWRRNDKVFELLPGGLRSQGPADSVEYATPRLAWRPIPSLDWTPFIKAVKTDLDQIMELKAAWGEGQPARRIEKIQDWINRHENTLGGGITEGPGTGWGSLEQNALMEIIQNSDQETAWKAIGTYSRSNEGNLPPCGALFANPRQRDFLLNIVQSPTRLAGEKARALGLLGARDVWKDGAKPEEVKKYNDLLVAGLKDTDPNQFKAAFESTVSLATTQPAILAESTRSTLKELYQACPPGPKKAALARALAAASGNEKWKELSGNDTGLVVAFTQMAAVQDRIQWKVERLHGVSTPQKVTIVREKIDSMGTVAELVTSPALEMDNPPWNSFVPLRGEWPVQTWNSGLWRVKAVGGDPKKPLWQSEIRLVRVTKPLKIPFTSSPPIGPTKVVIDPPGEK